MLVKTSAVYITDKSGKRFFNTLCSTEYASSEIRNLERKLEQAKQIPELYRFLDIATARIVQDGIAKVSAEENADMTIDELLAALEG